MDLIRQKNRAPQHFGQQLYIPSQRAPEKCTKQEVVYQMTSNTCLQESR